jgi:hypothetical protein
MSQGSQVGAGAHDAIAYARPLPPFERRAGEPGPAGACRVCGRLAWLRDDEGPVHGCCARVGAGGCCGACEEALRLHWKAEAWWQGRRRMAAA